jgi:hypothetical protein
VKKRRPNPRLVKIHRNYTVDEIGRVLGSHKATVRQWIKQGLPTTDDKRPMLILGRDLRAFIEKRRAGAKRPCGPGQIYCMRCRIPQEPADAMVECRARGPSLADLVGRCPACKSAMYRRVSLRKLPAVLGRLQVMDPEAPLRISERASPSVNTDFDQEAKNHANAQSE